MVLDAFARRTLAYVGMLATPLVTGTVLGEAAILLIG